MELPIAGRRIWTVKTSSLSRSVEAVLRRSLQASQISPHTSTRRQLPATVTIFRNEDETDLESSNKEDIELQDKGAQGGFGRVLRENGNLHQLERSLRVAGPVEALKVHLLASGIDPVLGGEDLWITDAAICGIMVIETVADTLKEFYDQSSIPELANTIVCDGFRKIFTILVLLGKVSSIHAFIADNTKDQDLPLRLEKSETGANKFFTQDGSPLNCFIDWQEGELNLFERTQWSVLSRAVVSPKDEVKDLMPIIKNYELEESLEPLNHSGGRVFRVSIQPDHHLHDDATSSSKPKEFAIKRFRDDAQFEHEAVVLQQLGINAHPNIVSIIAAYKKDNDHHLVFPLANGDLSDLWEKLGDPSHRRDGMLSWMLQQCQSLASALSHLHELTVGHRSAPATKLYGRHGDLKPSNILWYADETIDATDSLGTLKISDFGLSTLSRSDKPQQIQANMGMTLSYKPPEIDDINGKISRAQDIWSLGCVYLEFCTWYLLGMEGVNQFSHNRMARDASVGFANNFLTDTFFTVLDEEATDGFVFVLKPTVTNWIAMLRQHPRATPAVRQFLDLITNQMLLVSAEDRATALEIEHQLDKIRRGSIETGSAIVEESSSNPYHQGLCIPNQSNINVLIEPNKPSSPIILEKDDEDLRLILDEPDHIHSTFDRWRSHFEDFVGAGPVDWSPLPPLKRRILPSHSKLVWKYGERTLSIQLDEDETKRSKGRIRSATAGQNELPQWQQSNPPITGKVSTAQTFSHMFASLLRIFKNRKKDGDKERQNPNGLSRGNPGQTLVKQRESYFCVDKTWAARNKTVFTAPIVIEDLKDDADLYNRLNQTLGVKRWGLLQRIISWKSYNAVKLSQFSFQHDDNDIVSMFGLDSVRSHTSVCEGYEVPTAPFQTQGLDLDIYLRKIGETILTGLEEPGLGRGKNKVINSIPKRLVPPDLERTADTSGWGYHVCIGLCLRPLIVLINGTLVLGLAFVPFWLTSINKVDLQNAFAPVTFACMVLTLWLALAALEQTF